MQRNSKRRAVSGRPHKARRRSSLKSHGSSGGSSGGSGDGQDFNDGGSRNGRGRDSDEDPDDSPYNGVAKTRRHTHRNRRRRMSSPSNSSYISSDDSSNDGIEGRGAAKGTTKATTGPIGFGSEADIWRSASASGRNNTFSDLHLHPERLAAFIQNSHSECMASVDRGVAALQQRLQQSESSSASVASRVESVDASMNQLKGLVGSVVSSMQQQLLAHQAAANAALQQLQQTIAAHQQLVQQQQLSLQVPQAPAARASNGARTSDSNASHLRLPPYEIEGELERAIATSASADDAVDSPMTAVLASRVMSAPNHPRSSLTVARRSSIPLLAGANEQLAPLAAQASSWATPAESTGTSQGGGRNIVTRGTTVP